MLLALALYASTAHANVPHYDLDLLYHDGRAHGLDKRLLIRPRPPAGDPGARPHRAANPRRPGHSQAWTTI